MNCQACSRKGSSPIGGSQEKRAESAIVNSQKQPQTCAYSAPPPNRCPAASTRPASPLTHRLPASRRLPVPPPADHCGSIYWWAPNPFLTETRLQSERPTPPSRPSPAVPLPFSPPLAHQSEPISYSLFPPHPRPATNLSPKSLKSPQIPVQTTDHCFYPGSPDPLPNLDRFPRCPPIPAPQSSLLISHFSPPLSSPCGGIWPVLDFFILGLGSRIPYTFPASHFCPAMSEARHSTSARAS